MRILIKKRLSKVLAFGAVITFIVGSPVIGKSYDSTKPSELKEPIIKSAIDGILEAFKTHQIVGLSDAHGLAQEIEFYNTLIRDPRFARDVGNVVVEFGGAGRQDVIDRYVNGEFVPYKELRQVWTDTVGWIPTVGGIGYANFFAQVRQTNMKLPPEKRIRVWLGEPPIIWEKVKTRADYNKFRDRDGHAAKVIVRNILKQEKKALVIYGYMHFTITEEEQRRLIEEWARVDPENAWPVYGRLREKVEFEYGYPDSFFIVGVYTGLDDDSCTARFEQGMKNRPMPALVTSVRGSTLESEIRQCPSPTFLEMIGEPKFPPTVPKALQESIRDKYRRATKNDSLITFDAFLFLGPAANLTRSPMFPDLYLDEEYRSEIDRQLKIKGIDFPPDWMRNVPVTPMKYGVNYGSRGQN